VHPGTCAEADRLTVHTERNPIRLEINRFTRLSFRLATISWCSLYGSQPLGDRRRRHETAGWQLWERPGLTTTPIQQNAIDGIRPRGIVEYKDLVPQANDVDKIIELVFKVSEGTDNYRGIASYFQFNVRQSSYYREAAEALGLVRSKNGKYSLTDVGRELVRLPTERRNVFVAELLADFTLVKAALERLKAKGVLRPSDLEKLIR
jgi:hypothetical protein